MCTTETFKPSGRFLFRLVRENSYRSLVPMGRERRTIVESISALLTPVSGWIEFNGARIDREPTHKVVRLGICLVPEGKGIFPGLSVLENLEFGAFIPESRRVRQKTFEFVYLLFPILQSRRKQIAGTLSGGEQQMLAIGRALMSTPKLLMFDEPSLGLAPLVVKNIFKVIQQIRESGVSILLVEQNVRMALGIAQRAYVIENGRIGIEGDAKSLLDDEKIRKAYLGAG